MNKRDLIERIESNFPQDLIELEQWVLWRIEGRDGKPTKVPYAIGGYKAESNNPATWASFKAVCSTLLNERYDGLGFMFSEHDPYVGIDFDKCVTAGTMDGEKYTMMRSLDSYSETSPSGTGAHTIVIGKLPPTGRKSNLHGVEMYDRLRFFTVTGEHIQGTPIRVNARQIELSELHATIFPTKPAQRAPVPAGSVSLDDQELLTRMFNARNGGEIRSLWNGSIDAYGEDSSAADLALCSHLAFYTANDAERMDKLFRQSGLMRDKWDRAARVEDGTYGQGTIKRAIAGTGNVYTGRVNGNSGSNGAHHTNGASSNGYHHNEMEDKQAPQAKNDFRAVGHISEADKEHLTDLGNGKRLARLHGENLRYTQAWGWSAWDGARWRRDENGEVMRIAKQTALGFYAESARVMDKAKAAVKAAEDAASCNDLSAANEHHNKSRDLMRVADSLSDWAKKCQARARLESMIALGQSELPIAAHSDDFDKNDWLLNAKNGTIDLRTGTLNPHKKGDLITKVVPVVFDAKAQCPTWLTFLHRIMGGDQDVIDFLQRAIGYSLTGTTFDHALFFAYGSGQNGKSTFFETLASLLGDYWQKAPTEILMVKDRTSGIPNDIARLVGLRMVVAAEVEEGSRMAEKQVKDLTGGDTLVARFLNKEFFEFKPTHKVWMYGNHKPVIRGTDTGIWRRVQLIPFTVTIPEHERDADLKNKLAQELPGILVWAIQGCLSWQQNGLKPPTAVQLATEEYKTESDTFSAFLSECTVKHSTAKAQAGKLYIAYQTWCKENGERPIGGKRFGQQLVEHGFRKYQSVGRFIYEGIGLLREE